MQSFFLRKIKYSEVMNELESFRKRSANINLAKKLNKLVWFLSIAVIGLVIFMQKVKIPLPEGIELTFLPPFHACLNTLAALFLILAIRFIKQGKVILHQRMIYAAFVCSFVFLLSYVTYHFTTPATLYGDVNGDGLLSDLEKAEVGSSRILYLVILLTHIALAAISFPFILITFVYAFTNQFQKHRKLSKKVFPVWLYVAVTGPIVYFFLRTYY